MTQTTIYKIAQPNTELLALVDERGCVVEKARRNGDGLWMIQGRCYIDREAVVNHWKFYYPSAQ